MPGIFYGIGVGPGDPELLTCKGVRLLGEADVIAVPVAAPGKKSLAHAVAERFIGRRQRVVEIVLPMTEDRLKLEKAWETGRETIGAFLSGGESVAYLSLGDPLLYSTSIYLTRYLKKAGYRVVIVPGISSFSAAAAAAGVPLVFGDEKMAILPGPAVADLSAEVLSTFQTLVIFKVAGCYRRVVETLESAGRLCDSVLVVNCGLPGERITGDLKGALGEKLSYFSVIISRKEPPA